MKYMKGTRTEEIVFVPTLTQKPNRVLMGGFARESGLAKDEQVLEDDLDLM